MPHGEEQGHSFSGAGCVGGSKETRSASVWQETPVPSSLTALRHQDQGTALLHPPCIPDQVLFLSEKGSPVLPYLL